MKNLDLDNIGNLDESFSNFRAFGIGKPSQKQIDRWNKKGVSKEDSKSSLTHTYIDGTEQDGILIDANGDCRCSKELVDVQVGDGVVKMKKIIPYPKDKGFVEHNKNGDYFYFEPLPEYKMTEIKKLEDLIKDKTKSVEDVKQLAEQKLISKALFDKYKEIEDSKTQSNSFILYALIGTGIVLLGISSYLIFKSKSVKTV